MAFVLFTGLFLLGLVAGSYLNSWIWRYHKGEWSFPKRSICVHCSKELRWYDNVPVLSFLLLKGTCRFCGQAIPKEYPLVELAGGLLAALVGWHGFAYALSPVEFFRNIFLVFILLIVFVYDAKYMEIPTGVVWAGTVVAVLFNLIIFQSFNFQFLIFNLLLGMAVGGGFFWAQYLISKGRWIGGGDVRLGVLMGALLGWPMVVVALALSYIGGALVMTPFVIFKKKELTSAIPFGTFLAAGTLATLLWGSNILSWYVQFAKI